MVLSRQSSYPTSTSTMIKFMCSYGGRILPRYPNGRLRYHGGQTRLLSVDRSISFLELMEKLRDIMCATSSMVSLRCQLPNEDLDALVSITSDEDLSNIIEEYDRFAPQTTPLKIRAFLSFSAPKTTKASSPPPSSASSEDSTSPPPSRVNRGLPPKPPMYPNLGNYRNNSIVNAQHNIGGGYQYYPCCHHVYVNKG